ncbi:MAG: DNA-binding domain-containing protein [Burkholderiaceae bacterium]
MNGKAQTWQREAERQQQLLRALWRREPDDRLAPWTQGEPPTVQQGLAAYRGNAAVIAARALAAAYPTLQQLLGDASFENLARALWHRHPPQRGDLAHWGEELAAFVEADAQLAGEPYLADVARLEWAVHRIEHAADAPALPEGLPLLASEDPAAIALELQAGATLLGSRWPIVRIRQAHRMQGDTRFDAVRAALAVGQGDNAWVWRDGWRAAVQAIDAPAARFVSRVLAGDSLGAALDVAGEDFDFEVWLRDAITHHWIVGVRRLGDAANRSTRQ